MNHFDTGGDRGQVPVPILKISVLHTYSLILFWVGKDCIKGLAMGNFAVSCIDQGWNSITQDEWWKTLWLTGNKLTVMTQDERWLVRYNEVKSFIETNHRNPSRHRIEEHDMLNWLKANRKLFNAGQLKSERVEMFQELLTSMERYKRKNQYVWNDKEWIEWGLAIL